MSRLFSRLGVEWGGDPGPGVGGAPRGVRGGEVRVGGGALPGGRDRVVGPPARDRRERASRPRCVDGGLPPARHHRGRAATPWADHGRRHPGPGHRTAARLPRPRPRPPAARRRGRLRHPGRGVPSPQRLSRQTGPRAGARPAAPHLRRPAAEARDRGLGPGRGRHGHRTQRRTQDRDGVRRLRVDRPRRRPPGVAVPVGRRPRRLADRGGARRGSGRSRRHRAHGPPRADPAGRHCLGADPRALGHARPPGRAPDTTPPRHARRADHLPRTRHHREGRGDARRPHRRTRVRRRRCRLVGAGAPRLRPRLPAARRAARRARGRHRDDAGIVGAGHQGIRRHPGGAARDDVLPPTRRPAPRHRRRSGDRGRSGSAPDSATASTSAPTSSSTPARS